MSNILLSIIIPVYNVEHYLRESLDSVYSQNLEACEGICVNDGSTDNSRSILQEYKDIHNDLIIFDRRNGGLSAARNSGLKMANGKYVYFLDSDDYLLQDIIDRILPFVVENDLDIGCFNAKVGENKYYFTNKTEIEDVQSGKDYFINNYNQNGFFPPSAIWMYVYKREFLEINSLFFKEGIVHEDEHFSPRAFYLANQVKLKNIPILFHRVAREGAITYIIKKENLIDSIGNCADLYTFFQYQHCNEKFFYLKVFQNYLAVATRITAQYPRQKEHFFFKEDFIRMRVCAIGWEWYIYYWLFRYNSVLFRWYISDNSLILIKRGLNKFFKLFFKVSK